MYMPDPATVRILHQERVRDAEKQISQLNLIRESSEQVPNVTEEGLLHRMKQLMHVGKHVQPQSQDCNDVHPAHAI